MFGDDIFDIFDFESDFLGATDDEDFGGMDTKDPDDIRYMHNSIRPKFTCTRPLTQTISELEAEGDERVMKIPTITIFQYHGKWFSVNNRRLYCFKKASNIDKIPVNIVDKDDVGYFESRFTTKNEGTDVRVSWKR